MTLPIRTGVIGVGNIGQHHARIYASLPDSHLVGIADIHPGRAQEIADRYQVPAYADYRALLDQVWPFPWPHPPRCTMKSAWPAWSMAFTC